MDQTAQLLFSEGGTLVFLDVPEGTEFGIDYNTWNVGSRFKGVKMIPPGLHFMYYSACNKNGQAAPRTGFFHYFKHREVLVKKWDQTTEDIKAEVISEEELERFKTNKENLDKYLGAYPYENYKKWVSLTSHITENLMKRLNPAGGKISSVAEIYSAGSTTESRKASAAEADKTYDKEDKRLPFMQVMPGTEIQFTTLPKHNYPERATPAEITKYSMDHSYTLTTLFNTVYKDCHIEILGEVQFAFVCFLIGQVYDGFEQWKKLVNLLCSCEEALHGHTELFNQFIGVLHYQVHEIPEDFFVDIVSCNNFLTTTLQTFFSNLENAEGANLIALRKKGLSFRNHLQKKFKWDFTSEPDDYAPTIVE